MIKICECCKKEFEAKTERKKYCSNKCKTKINDKKTKLCEWCNKEFIGRRETKYCSKDCYKQGKLKNQKISNIKKYGVEYVFQANNVKEQIKKTNLRKYDVEYVSQNKIIKQKQIETLEKNYGVSNPSLSSVIQERKKETSNKKYGVDHYSKTEEYKDRCRNTCKNKYGVDHYSKTEKYKENYENTMMNKYGYKATMLVPEIREKIEIANKEKYGSKSPFGNKDIQKKSKETLMRNYGVDNSLKLKKVNDIRNSINNPSYKNFSNIDNYNEEYIKKNFINNEGYFEIHNFCNYFNIRSLSNAYLIKKRFNINVPNIVDKHHTQKEIYEFIKSIYDGEILFNTKSLLINKEVDIYIPEKNLAIEYDGLMFHSYGKDDSCKLFDNADLEDRNYHLNKTKLCEEKGVKLLHIFENEWLDLNKQNIWKSIIKSNLGLSDKKIYARECEIKTLEKSEVKEFCMNNHIQDYTNDEIRIGLLHNNELVSVMTFGRSRYNKKYDWELLRFCNKLNTSVVGAFSKLLSYFKVEKKGSILSYGNRRWTYLHSNVYKQQGALINTSDPNYFYFTKRDFVLHSRQKFQKHKLKDKLENFDSNLTESDNMYNHGFRKIYDCGNLVYEL